MVDYIMVDSNVHEKVIYFKVMPLTPLSDHCQIETELAIKPRVFTFTSKGSKGTKAQPQYKWDNTSMYKVNSYVKSREFLEKVDVIQSMLSSTGDVNNDAENINSLLIIVSDRCLKVVKVKKAQKGNKEYFDTNCYNKRREVQRLANLVNNSPNNISLRNSYHQTKGMYKLMMLMIKNKRRSYKERKLKQISNLMDSEVKKKWSIIKSAISTKDLCDPAENITMDRWKMYFEKLGTNGQGNDNLPDYNHSITDTEILCKLSQEINKLITETEIKILAKEKLPKSKAVGLDRIRNEIISSCLQKKTIFRHF